MSKEKQVSCSKCKNYEKCNNKEHGIIPSTFDKSFCSKFEEKK